MTDKVEKEVSFRYGDHFVGDFHEQTETLTGAQRQPLRNIRTEIFCSRRRIHFKSFVGVVGKEHFVKYLRGLVLYGLYFHLMGCIFSLAVPYGFLQPL